MISLARRDGRVLRIGHRGAAALAPENTLRSFRAALAAGVDLVEFDVLALRGGQLVVAHSNDLFEVSHGRARGTLEALRLDELRELCPELPTFADALEFFSDEGAGVGVHVDLKTARSADEVADALERHALLDRTFLSSFHFRAIRRLARREPRIATGISFPRDPLRLHGRRRAGPLVRGGLAAMRAAAPRLVRLLLRSSRAGALVLQHTIVSRATVDRAHALGAPVVAWTVDDPLDLARVEEAGVDAVVTNDPGLFAVLSTLSA